MLSVTSIVGGIAKGFTATVWDNAVIIKDLRTRMRGTRAFAVMGGYVTFLAVVMLIRFYAESAVTGSGNWVNSRVGAGLFGSLTWTQMILLTLVVPSLTSGALSHELERKTIELLALTRLTPGKLVFGKTLSALLFAIVLPIASMPLAGICLMFGGISPEEMAVTYAHLAAWVFLLAALGIFWSSVFPRTAASALLAYGTSALYMIATLIVGLSLGDIMWGGGGSDSVHPLAGLNPAIAQTMGLHTSVICGLHIPSYLIVFTLHTLIGLLSLYAAGMRVKHMKADKSCPVRILLIAITVLLVWVIAGGPSVFLSNQYHVLTTMQNVLLVCSAIAIAELTGPIKLKSGTSVWRYALSGRKAFSDDLGGSITFLVLLAAVAYGTFGITALWSARAVHTTITSFFWPNYWRLGVASIAVVAGLAAGGVLISCFSRTRASAAIITLGFVAIMLSGYGITLAGYNKAAGAASASPFWQLAAFWPFTSQASIKGLLSYLPPPYWPRSASWLVVTICYVVMGTLLLALTSKVWRKYGGVREE